MAEEPSYDLVILGSGSTAFAAALRAQELGKTAVLIEERTTGGTCVNRGCLPSKNLIEAARIVHEASHPRYPGLKPAKLEFDFEQLIAQKDEIIRDYRRKNTKASSAGRSPSNTGMLNSSIHRRSSSTAKSCAARAYSSPRDRARSFPTSKGSTASRI